MKSEVLSKIRNIKLFLFDLEGVLLHSGMPVEKCFDSISKISSDFNDLDLEFGIVTARSDDDFIEKLRSIDKCIVLSGSLAKVNMTDNYLHSRSIEYENVFYMGDELLDIPLLQKCGLSCAPKSARREVKRVVTFTVSADNCEDILNEIFSYLKKIREPASRATKY